VGEDAGFNSRPIANICRYAPGAGHVSAIRDGQYDITLASQTRLPTGNNEKSKNLDDKNYPRRAWSFYNYSTPRQGETGPA